MLYFGKAIITKPSDCQQCQAREDFLYWERMKKNRAKRMEEKIAEQEAELAAKDAQIAELLAQLDEATK